MFIHSYCSSRIGRQHGLPTHIAFIDLVKAYDTANHELLLQVLKKYGAPPKLIDVVRRLYTDLRVVLKIGKLKTEILQGVGVRQGDNMAGVLFLFLMTAFADLMEKKFAQAGILRAIRKGISYHPKYLYIIGDGDAYWRKNERNNMG